MKWQRWIDVCLSRHQTHSDIKSSICIVIYSDLLSEWNIKSKFILTSHSFLVHIFIHIFSWCNDATINLLYYNFIWLFQVEKLQNKWEVIVNLVCSQIFHFFLCSSKFWIGFMIVFSCVWAKVSYLLFKFDLNIEISEEFECDAKRFLCWENLYRF